MSKRVFARGYRHSLSRHRQSANNPKRLLRLECLESRVVLAATNPLDLSSLDGSIGFRIDGIKAEDFSGASVSGAGDVNGDGYDDLILGAPFSDPDGAGQAGQSYVVFGKPSGFSAAISLGSLDGTNGFRIDGIDPGDASGTSVSSAGDINGDGADDLIIGANGADPVGRNLAGESYVVFGRTDGFGPVLELSGLDGTNGFRLEGVAADDFSGRPVSGAGDVNGDGFDDLIVGANNAEDSAGESYVVFGKAAGFSAVMKLSDLDGTNGFRLDGNGPGDISGYSVSGAGDVNGDGFDDLIVGARNAGPGGSGFAGETYVVFGKSGGFSATLALGDLDGSDGFRINGVNATDYSGHSVSSAGDVNGDGFDDLIIGAEGADPRGMDSAGESYVVFGRADAFPAAMELSDLDGTDGFRLEGIDADDLSGRSVSGAGDMNGDGFDDLLIGAEGADAAGKESAGESYVVFGKAGGLSASLDLSSLDGTTGFRLDGIEPNDYSGNSVSGAGDVNGDGFDDLIIGGSGADPGGRASAGQTFVVFGGDFTGAATHIGDSEDNVLEGDAGADVMIGAQGNDLLRGAGGADVLRGGSGDDELVIADLAFARAAGGNGIDTLRLDASGVTLDLTLVADNRVTDIEAIDIRGGGANTLTLDLNEALNLSTHSNTVIVHRDVDDQVDIGTGWADVGTETISGSLFRVFTQGAATVKVQEVTDIGHTNPTEPLDVDDDGFIVPKDALLVINYLNSIGAGPISGVNTGPPFFDVSGDDNVTPIDALLVINHLNKVASGAEGEGPASGLSTTVRTGNAADRHAADEFVWQRNS